MGGKFAETADSTTDVLIESAHFDPVLIRQSVQRIDLGMESRGTAASYRFERGTDPNLMLEGALKRTSQLVVEIAGGSVVGPLLDQYPAQRKPRRFTIDPARTTAYLGMEVSAGRIRECLGRLSMECGGDDSAIDVTVPTWRADVNDPVVLIEDVARLVGYEAIPDAPRPSQPSLGMRSATDRLRQNVSESLVRLGFLECRNPSLESPQSSRWLGDVGPAITVGNAATREMSVLRRTLLSGLAATVQTNVRRGAQSAWFFEVDRLFGQGELESLSIEAANGRWHLAGIAGGQLDRSSWVSHGASVDFFTLKGVVEDVLELVGARDLVWKPMDRRPFVAGTSAEILLGPDRPIGLIGEIDPKAVEFERVPFRTFAFELDLEALEGAFGELKSYHQLQRQPAVGRDIAVVVSMEVAYADILSTIRQAAGPNLEKVELVDRYQGSQVPAGHQSLAFHTIFRDRERTLTAEEVAEVLDRVVTVLKDRFGAELRS
jgi:phenylalanyl-tRNA synthetase beta chain